MLLALALPQSAQTTTKPDALALLNEVSQRYADAKSYHIEAVQERVSSNELFRDWQKTLLTAIAMPGGRYRYEGRSGFGSAVLVSDGTTQWDYHAYDHLYTQQPSSSNDPQAGRVIGPEEGPVHDAKSLINRMAHRADRVKSARYLPDETVSVNGKSVDCYLVQYFNQPSQESDAKFEWTEWIDKSRKVVLKTFEQGNTFTITMARSHIPLSTETTATYPVLELDQQEPDSSFTFVPPADAKLVVEFPDYFAKNSLSITPADLTGKPAPEIQFQSPDGKITMLSSFRGKPVFLEFWATSCGPCVELMPGLGKLYAETEPKGLAWIGIDSDEDSIAVASFLSRDHVSWPNYHDENGTYGKAFHRTGIPLGVLIDAEGKITFYKSGYGIADLRSAIAELGPEFATVASASPSLK